MLFRRRPQLRPDTHLEWSNSEIDATGRNNVPTEPVRIEVRRWLRSGGLRDCGLRGWERRLSRRVYWRDLRSCRGSMICPAFTFILSFYRLPACRSTMAARLYGDPTLKKLRVLIPVVPVMVVVTMMVVGVIGVVRTVIVGVVTVMMMVVTMIAVPSCGWNRAADGDSAYNAKSRSNCR
jgi:hypothetical protein